MKITIVLSLVAFTIATTTSGYAQDQPVVPDGSTSKISDWALSGVIWSDASLTKKLARQAAKEANSPEQAAQFKKIFQQSSRIVEAMETFGWKQVKSTTTMNDSRAPQPSRGEKPLPDPEDVGAALAKSMNFPPMKTESSERRERSTRPTQPAQTPTLDPSIKRFDTETPAGRDDPGIDDERTNDGIALDVDNYRVDDYIDETPAEARNQADAIEDGVEGAIAAASGRLGMSTGTADHFGYRESQTLSGTLPYAQGSIYGFDNSLVTDATDPESVDRGDRDDDIDRGDPA